MISTRGCDAAGLARRAQDVQARADRRERVAQFVRERRQEFVLAAIRLLQRLDRAPPFGDVDARPYSIVGLPSAP